MNSPEPTAVDTAQTVADQTVATTTPQAVDPAATAMQGPDPEPVSAAGVAAAPMPPADTPAAALGRRTLSTAFVQIGPDGHLTVERHDGHVLVLRDVTMGPKKYCGVAVGAGTGGKRYCGAYAEVAAARPGGGPLVAPPEATTTF